MSEVNALYLLQNQDKLFLSKAKDWVDATDRASLYRSRYKDEAINQLVETNSKDVTQRIRCVECEAGAKGQPIIDPGIMPEPLPKPERAQKLVEEGAITPSALDQDSSANAADNAQDTIEQGESQLALTD